jgi:hypothetical protein
MTTTIRFNFVRFDGFQSIHIEGRDRLPLNLSGGNFGVVENKGRRRHFTAQLERRGSLVFLEHGAQRLNND